MDKTPIILQLTGLFIEIVGAILIFFNSPKIEYQVYQYQKTELETLNKKASKNHFYTRLGLMFLILGFLVQGSGVAYYLC